MSSPRDQRADTRERLLLKAPRSFPARGVIDALEEVMVCSGRRPQCVRSDSGPEFVAKLVQRWLVQAQVGPRYIEPGAPWENAYVESFHAQVRLELLDRELFFNLRGVNAATGHYAYEYNFKRPHGSLGKRPPSLATQRQLPLRPTACAPVRAVNLPMNKSETSGKLEAWNSVNRSKRFVVIVRRSKRHQL